MEKIFVNGGIGIAMWTASFIGRNILYRKKIISNSGEVRRAFESRLLDKSSNQFIKLLLERKKNKDLENVIQFGIGAISIMFGLYETFEANTNFGIALIVFGSLHLLENINFKKNDLLSINVDYDDGIDD